MVGSLEIKICISSPFQKTFWRTNYTSTQFNITEISPSGSTVSGAPHTPVTHNPSLYTSFRAHSHLPCLHAAPGTTHSHHQLSSPVGTWGLFCLLETINVNSKSTPTYSQYKKGITGFASLDAVTLLPANYLIKMELWTGANTAKKIIFIAIFITLRHCK